jgi:hypothetical protein
LEAALDNGFRRFFRHLSMIWAKNVPGGHLKHLDGNLWLRKRFDLATFRNYFAAFR